MSLLTVNKYYKTNVNDDENKKMKDMIENFRKERENSVCVDEDVIKYIYEDWDDEKINKCIEDNSDGICSYLYDKMKEMISDDLEEWGNKYDKEKYGVCDCCDDILYENIPIVIWTNDKEDKLGCKEFTVCKECSDDCEEGYREDGWICDEDEECGKCGQMFDREGNKLDDGMGCRECCPDEE